MRLIVEITVQLSVIHPFYALLKYAKAFLTVVSEVKETAMLRLHAIVLTAAAMLPVP